MIIGRNLINEYYEDEKLYSTGDDELDDLLEKAFCEGYEYAQREFGNKANKAAKRAYEIKEGAKKTGLREFISDGIRTLKNPNYDKEALNAYRRKSGRNRNTQLTTKLGVRGSMVAVPYGGGTYLNEYDGPKGKEFWKYAKGKRKGDLKIDIDKVINERGLGRGDSRYIGKRKRFDRIGKYDKIGQIEYDHGLYQGITE